MVRIGRGGFLARRRHGIYLLEEDAAPVEETCYLLLENGDNILLQDGGLMLAECHNPAEDTYLLLENGDNVLLEDGALILLG